MTNYSADGYAPSVPGDIDLETADEYTLLSIVRDTLQNGANPTRGNMAFGLLVDKLAVPVPDLPMDRLPYRWDAPGDLRSANSKAHDPVYGYVHFCPRFGYAQERERYSRFERIDCRDAEKPLAKGPSYYHPNAVDVGECRDGCCDDYRCPDCGTEFRVEAPD